MEEGGSSWVVCVCVDGGGMFIQSSSPIFHDPPQIKGWLKPYMDSLEVSSQEESEHSW